MTTTRSTTGCSFIAVKHAATLSTVNVADTLTVSTAVTGATTTTTDSLVVQTLQIGTGVVPASAAALTVLPGAGDTLSVADAAIVCDGADTTTVAGTFAPDAGITATATFPARVLTFTSGVLTHATTPPGTQASININTGNVSAGSSNTHSFALPLVTGTTYNFVVAWGDGRSSVITAYNQHDVTHTYAAPGAYTLEITGTLTGWSFNGGGDRLKVLNINSWGPIVIGAVGDTGCFSGCANLTISSDAGSPVSPTATTSLASCFSGCTSLNSTNVATWDVSAVQDISLMFFGCTAFNVDLSSWNTSAVQLMNNVFDSCSSFDNGGALLRWTTDAVTNISGLFANCAVFNQRVVFSNLSQVTYANNMFAQCLLFNNGDVTNAGTKPLDLPFGSALRTADAMFFNAVSFNQSVSLGAPANVESASLVFGCQVPGVSVFNNGDTADVALKPLRGALPFLSSATGLFLNCGSFNQTVEFLSAPTNGGLDVSGTFEGCAIFNNGNAPLTIQKPVSSSAMFQGCLVFNQTVTFTYARQLVKADNMFNGCSLFNNGDTGDTGAKPLTFTTTAALTDTSQMFADCAAFNQHLVISDVTGVTTMGSMFSGCSRFNNGVTGNNGGQSLTFVTTSALTNVNEMFAHCSLFNQTLVVSDVSNVVATTLMFYGCSLFNNGATTDAGGLPLTFTTTAALQFADYMFGGCAVFNQHLVISNVTGVTTMAQMFNGCFLFNNGVTSNAGGVALTFTTTTALTDTSQMFGNCRSFNQTLVVSDMTGVTATTQMFNGCSLFNNGVVTNAGGRPLTFITTVALADTSGMFFTCSAFNQALVVSDTTGVATMLTMFFGCSLFNNGVTTDAGGASLTFTTTAALTDTTTMFYACSAFNQTLIMSDMSGVASISQMFHGATLFNNGSVGNTGTHALAFTTGPALVVADGVFSNCAAFNQTFTLANTTNLTAVNNMFENATLFNNGDTGNTGTFNFVSIPQTSAILTTAAMFNNAASFNQTVAFSNMSSLQTCAQMFSNAAVFNNGDVGDLSGKPMAWTAPSLNNTSQMFLGCVAFNQAITLTSLLGPSLTDVSYMFQQAVLFNQHITLDTLFVTSMNSMFAGAAAFNNGEVGTNTGAAPLTLSTGFVSSFDSMFFGATQFNQQLLFSDTSVGSFAAMFLNATLFNNGGGVHPLTWNVSAAVSFAGMFSGAASFNQKLEFTNTSNVQNMVSMFSAAAAFNNGDSAFVASAPISWDTGKVEDMSTMFNACEAFNQQLVFSDTSKVKTTANMFFGCTAFNNGDVANTSAFALNWNLASLQTARSMFLNCSVFNQPLNFANMSNMTSMSTALSGCNAFKQDISSWTVTACSNFTGFFTGDLNSPNSGASQAHYNALLVAWEAEAPLQTGVTLDMGTTRYSAAAAGAARAVLTGVYGWAINDGGAVA